MDTKHIVAIDLGTSKTALTVAEINNDNVQIVYYKKIPSDGIRYSYIANPKKAADTIRTLVEDAEKELKIKIRRAVVGMPKYSVRQEASSGQVPRSNPDEYITEEEIDSLKQEAMDSYPLKNPDTEELLAAVAQSFSNGDEMGMPEKDIVGVSGDVLEGDFKLFIGKKKNIKDIDVTFKSLGIDVVKKYFTPETTAMSVLKKSEIENGVALVDLGAGVTTVTVYYRNIMRLYAAIPFGGNSVTSDIKTECWIPEDLSENLKKAFGGCMPDKLLNLSEKTLHINNGSAESNVQIPVKYLSEIITARMKEIIDAVLYEIQLSGLADNLRNGIVITGGGAKLMNCAAYIKELSGYEVRCGGSGNLFSASGYEAIFDLDASTSAGIIAKAKADRIPDCASEEGAAETQIPIEVVTGGREELTEEDEETVFDQPDVEEVKKTKKKEVKKTEKPKKKNGMKWNIGSLFDNLYDTMEKEKA